MENFDTDKESSGNSYGSDSYSNYNYSSTYHDADNTWRASENGYEQPKETKRRKKKERKEQKGGSGNFGMKLLKVVAVALVFGLVAGSVLEGTTYFIGEKLGNGETKEVQSSAAGEEKEKTEGALDNSNASVKSTATGTQGVVATDVTDVVASVMPSIVAITNISVTQYQSFFGQTGSYENESAGSGIIVAQDDDYLYIATNNHVVESAESLTVQFVDDSTVSAEVKGVDDSRDLAVIQIANSSIEADTLSQIKIATLGDSTALKVGQSAIAIGNALGYGQSVTTGVVSALDRDVTVQDSATGASVTNTCIQTDAAINPGNSGGALLNTNGEVIGINEVKYANTSVEGIGYAIPMSTAGPIIEQIITREAVAEDQAAYLGIQGIDVTDTISSQYNMPQGVYVAQVVSGSPAEQAGIITGDIITTFDGNEINSKESLENIMTYYAAGSQIDLVVKRANNGQYEEQTLTVTLGSKNQ